MDASGLMTGVDELDFGAEQRVEHRHDVVAGHREDVRNAKCFQRFRNKIRASLHAASALLPALRRVIREQRLSREWRPVKWSYI
jgi:hypothetical protein